MSLSHTQNVLVKLFKFQQGKLTTVIIIIIFWNISSGISLKLEKKNGATFLKFQSISILTGILCNRRQKSVSVPKHGLKLNNRSASLFLNFNC